MKYRIMYCEKCGKEYKNILDNYDEKCICGYKLKMAFKIKEKEYTCIKIL